MTFRRIAWGFPAAYAVHLVEGGSGVHCMGQRNASERYKQRDFVRNNAVEFAATTAATIAVTRSEGRALEHGYYTLIVGQQALLNAVFHAGATVAFGDIGDQRRAADRCDGRNRGVATMNTASDPAPGVGAGLNRLLAKLEPATNSTRQVWQKECQSEPKHEPAGDN